MSGGVAPQGHGYWPGRAWALIAEARTALAAEPLGAAVFARRLGGCESFAEALIRLIADGLDAAVPKLLEASTLAQLAAAPQLVEAAARDLVTAHLRDPAAPSILVHFHGHKGYQALQCWRIARALWLQGERHLACLLQAEISRGFGLDIHPAVSMGSGVLLDHATGIVIGETALVEDDVSIWQGVCLGSTFKAETGPRHPTVRRGAVLCAGAIVLGPIEVGEAAVVAAGSVVLTSVPARATVAGAPARVVRQGSSLQLIGHTNSPAS